MPELIDIDLAVTLDDVCNQVLAAMDEGREIHEVHVAPEVYDTVAKAKAKQHLSRDNPLLLLALDLVSDENVAPGHATIA